MFRERNIADRNIFNVGITMIYLQKEFLSTSITFKMNENFELCSSITIENNTINYKVSISADDANKGNINCLEQLSIALFEMNNKLLEGRNEIQ